MELFTILLCFYKVNLPNEIIFMIINYLNLCKCNVPKIKKCKCLCWYINKKTTCNLPKFLCKTTNLICYNKLDHKCICNINYNKNCKSRCHKCICNSQNICFSVHKNCKFAREIKELTLNNYSKNKIVQIFTKYSIFVKNISFGDPPYRNRIILYRFYFKQDYAQYVKNILINKFRDIYVYIDNNDCYTEIIWQN